MPLRGNREPSKTSLYYLHSETLKDSFNEIAPHIQDAGARGYKSPYTMDDLLKSCQLFSAEDGYINVMKDMTDGRIKVHGRKWDPMASTWAERLVPPPISKCRISVEGQGLEIPYTMKDLDTSCKLFLAENGYVNVMSDLLDGRINVHGRTWNPMAKTWQERMVSKFSPQMLVRGLGLGGGVGIPSLLLASHPILYVK